MAAHCNILAWKILLTEEPDGLRTLYEVAEEFYHKSLLSFNLS